MEAIGGRRSAADTARALGLDYWDARHVSDAFQLTNVHRGAFLRNKARIWAKETREVPVDGADEIALGVVIDAYARTELVSVISVAPRQEVRSQRGWVLLAGRGGNPSVSQKPLPPLPRQAGRTPQLMLDRIESEFDNGTARYVALTLEYPWRNGIALRADGCVGRQRSCIHSQGGVCALLSVVRMRRASPPWPNRIRPPSPQEIRNAAL